MKLKVTLLSLMIAGLVLLDVTQHSAVAQVPDEWTCNPSFFNVQDGCDCECGAPDPDCLVPDQQIFNCPDNAECSAEGFCIIPTQSPTTGGPTPAPPTPQSGTNSPTNSAGSSGNGSTEITVEALAIVAAAAIVAFVAVIIAFATLFFKK